MSIHVNGVSEVLCQELDEEAVLLHLPTERYFGLNNVGSRAWQLWEGGSTLEASIQQIVAEYDAPEEVIRQDVANLVKQLTERGLIKVEER